MLLSILVSKKVRVGMYDSLIFTLFLLWCLDVKNEENLFSSFFHPLLAKYVKQSGNVRSVLSLAYITQNRKFVS